MGLQPADQTADGAGAEGAAHPAAHLGGDADGVAVVIAHEHRLDAVSVLQTPQIFDGAIHLGDLLSGDLQVLGRIGGAEITAGVPRLYNGSIAKLLVGEAVTFTDTRTASDLSELYRCLTEYGMMEHIVTIDMVSRFDITLNYADRFTIYLADIDNMDIKIRFLQKILEKLKPTDRGYINLSDHREAAVRLETEEESAEE